MVEAAMSRCVARPRAILFDWDKTLVDNWDAIVAALNETFTAMGHKAMTPDEARMKIRKSARESFPELFSDRAEEALEIFYAAFARHHCTDLQPMNGAQELLDTLASLKMRTGVVSNKTADYLNKEIKHLGWEKYFDVVVGAGEAEFDKPDPAPINLAIERGNMGPGSTDIWYVGDNEMDMLCAHNAGLLPVLVNTLDLPATHFNEPDAMPALSFDNYESFGTYIAGWQDQQGA